MSLLLLFGGTAAPAVTRLTITFSPSIPLLNQPLEVTALLLDPDGTPMNGRTIYFDVSGANTDSGSDTTDVNGEATFTYTTSNAGTDAVKATWGAPSGLDLVVADFAGGVSGTIKRYDGFSTTPLDSYTYANPQGLAWDGDNLISCDNTVVRKHSGLTSSITSSITPGHSLRGIAWTKEGNLVTTDSSTVYIHDGFSTTVTSSWANPAPESIQGLGYDGDNLLFCTSADWGGPINHRRFYRMVGVSSSVESFLDDGEDTRSPKSIAWDGENLIVGLGDGTGGVTDVVRRYDGFSLSLDTELLIANSNPNGVEWTAALWAEEVVSVSRYGSGHLGRRTARLVP